MTSSPPPPPPPSTPIKIDFVEFHFKHDNLSNTDRIRETAFNIDHVIELQLVKLVLNSAPYLIEYRAIHAVSGILNQAWNLEIVTRRYNSAKAKLIEGILEGIEVNSPSLVARYLESRVYGTFGWENSKSGWRSGYEIIEMMLLRLETQWDLLRAHHDFRARLLSLLRMILASTQPPGDRLSPNGIHSSSSLNLAGLGQSDSNLNVRQPEDWGVSASPSKKLKTSGDP